MVRRALPGLFLALAFVTAVWAAADKALGTFTVSGRTVRFTEVYATLEPEAPESGRQYLMLIVADRKVAAPDRTPARLQALAQAGNLHALRIRWTYGTDELMVVPYHRGVVQSGRAFASLATLNLTRLDDRKVGAEFKSKMLGQDWHFNAIVEAAIAKGGMAVLEPDAEQPPAAAPVESGSPGESTPMALKRRLGAMGYEFTPEAFFHAIADRRVDAVELFLQAGLSPNAQDDRKRSALTNAVLFCAADPASASAVVVALVRAKADVRARDPDNQTTPLIGAVSSCTVEAIAALIDAGSDLSARSAGGATALQLAEVYQRPDVVKLLKK
jgi:Ankyrin repeats (many copies)